MLTTKLETLPIVVVALKEIISKVVSPVGPPVVFFAEAACDALEKELPRLPEALGQRGCVTRPHPEGAYTKEIIGSSLLVYRVHVRTTQRLQSSSFLVVTYVLVRDYNLQPKKELL